MTTVRLYSETITGVLWPAINGKSKGTPSCNPNGLLLEFTCGDTLITGACDVSTSDQCKRNRGPSALGSKRGGIGSVHSRNGISAPRITFSGTPNSAIHNTNNNISKNNKSNDFTCLAFNPFDHTRLCFGDGGGTVYAVAMKRNCFFICARLTTGAAVTAITFKSLNTIVVASAMQIFIVDLEHSRIVQKVLNTPHNHHIIKIVTHPAKKNYLVTISSDTLAIWRTSPLECIFNTNEQGTSVSASDVARVTAAFHNRVNPDPLMSQGNQRDDGVAEGKTLPLSDRQVVVNNNNNQHTSNKNGKVEDILLVRFAGFIDADINECGALVTLEGKGMVTLWVAPPSPNDNTTDLSEDQENTNVTPSHPSHDVITPIYRVDVAPHQPSCLAVSHEMAVIGTKGHALLCINLEGLKGLVAVTIPGSAGIASISMVEEEMIACMTVDGRGWFVSVSDYSVLFSLVHSNVYPVRGMRMAGATYAGVLTKSGISIYHMGGAKAYYDRTNTVGSDSSYNNGVTKRGNGNSCGGEKWVYPFLCGPNEPQRNNRSSSSSPIDRNIHKTKSAELFSSSSTSAMIGVPSALPRHILKLEESQTQEWIKVNLRGVSNRDDLGPQTMLLNDAIRSRTHTHKIENGDNKSSLASHNFHERSKTGINRSSTTNNKTTSGRNLKTTTCGPRKSDVGRLNAVTLRGLLSTDSITVNMNKLRSMLLNYGVFPDLYRPLIWRFLLQLPHKDFTAPQFGNLTMRGSHPAVDALMTPYPLPDSDLRNDLIGAVSALCWHSPVFTAVHYIPNLLFPFVKVFKNDVQSAIEIFLAFLINWGQEFFLYYPHPPVSVVIFISHTLKAVDPEIHNHFEMNGVGSDVYVWDSMESVYSEILTKGEWLQVMDHAFANEPIWLYLFHVRWLCHIRDLILTLHEYNQIVDLIHRATPININLIIQQTYQLHNTYIRSDLSEPYRHFHTFQNDIYPSILECNEAVIATKVHEMERAKAHETEVLNMRQRIGDIKRQLVQAQMLEDAFIGKRKAKVAAKFEASDEIWSKQVQLERERQRLRDIEHEARLDGIQEQLRSAKRIESLQAEIHAVSASARDSELDRQREIMKWNFADKMANQEMERLEAGVRMKLSSVILASSVMEEKTKIREGFVPKVSLAPNVKEVKIDNYNIMSPSRRDFSSPHCDPHSAASIINSGVSVRCSVTRDAPCQSASNGHIASDVKEDSDKSHVNTNAVVGTVASPISHESIDNLNSENSPKDDVIHENYHENKTDKKDNATGYTTNNPSPIISESVPTVNHRHGDMLCGNRHLLMSQDSQSDYTDVTEIVDSQDGEVEGSTHTFTIKSQYGNSTLKSTPIVSNMGRDSHSCEAHLASEQRGMGSSVSSNRNGSSVLYDDMAEVMNDTPSDTAIHSAIRRHYTEVYY